MSKLVKATTSTTNLVKALKVLNKVRYFDELKDLVKYFIEDPKLNEIYKNIRSMADLNKVKDIFKQEIADRTMTKEQKFYNQF